MKLSKLLLAVVGATVLLGAFVSSASAGRLSQSSETLRATWTRMNFSGSPFGTVECEVVLEGRLHTRTMNKVNLSLMGYLTAANVTRCARGSATVLRETLPWHVRYSSFVGALPNITAIRTLVVGSSFTIREPAFGATCLARATPEEPSTGTYNRETGTGLLVSASVGGEIRCRGGIEVTGGLSGTSSTLTNSAGARVSVTLI
jgi:hypothetical protein